MSKIIDAQPIIDAIRAALNLNIESSGSAELEEVLKQLEAQPEADSSDIISRHAAIKALDECGDEPWIYKESAVEAIEMIEPSAEPKRIKGRWIDTGVKFPNKDGQIVYEVFCSECKGIAYFRHSFGGYIGADYCPRCNADMREVTE